MIPLHDKRSIEMWFSHEFPGEAIQFIRKRNGGFMIVYQNERLDTRKVKRIVTEFYRCAYGIKVAWGKVCHVGATK